MQRRHPGRGVRATLFAAASTLALTAFCTDFTAVANEVGTKAVTWDDIVNDEATTNDVVSWGMGVRNHRYSALDRINTENIAQMKPAWSFSFGDEKQRGQETQALVHDGVIYVTASYSRARARRQDRQAPLELHAPPARRHPSLL